MGNQQAAAGWYPVEDNRMRYWDGQAWTEHFHEGAPEGQEQPQVAAAKPATSRLRGAASAAATSLTSNEQELPEGTLWSAIGKTIGKVTTGRYRLDPVFLYYSKGALRTQWQQVFVASIVDVDVRQSVTQKARGVYTVLVRLHDRTSFTMDDIPDGPAAQRIITKAGVDARLAVEQRSISIEAQRHDVTNTVRQEVRIESNSGLSVHPQTVAGTVIPQPGSGAALPKVAPEPQLPELAAANAEDATGPTSAPDYIAQLRELGELRDAGILTDDEFTAKKAEILARI